MFAQLGYYICVPFAWLTRLFYTWTGSYGVALILFTLIVKLVLLPFQLKSKKSMLRMGRMNSKVQEIQKKYANNKERQQQEIADLYAREGVNPMSGCLWSFLPFPILIALYYITAHPCATSCPCLMRSSPRSPSWRCPWGMCPAPVVRPLLMTRSIWPSSSTITGPASRANSMVLST